MGSNGINGTHDTDQDQTQTGVQPMSESDLDPCHESDPDIEPFLNLLFGQAEECRMCVDCKTCTAMRAPGNKVNLYFSNHIYVAIYMYVCSHEDFSF